MYFFFVISLFCVNKLLLHDVMLTGKHLHEKLLNWYWWMTASSFCVLLLCLQQKVGYNILDYSYIKQHINTNKFYFQIKNKVIIKNF